MSKLLRALTLINERKEQSLVCEVPTELINNLNIDKDGKADLSTLLEICKHITEKKGTTPCKKFETNRQLMRLIYDQSLAVNNK